MLYPLSWSIGRLHYNVYACMYAYIISMTYLAFSTSSAERVSLCVFVGGQHTELIVDVMPDAAMGHYKLRIISLSYTVACSADDGAARVIRVV